MIGLARLGRDCETPRYTPNGTAVVNLSLAFNYGMKDDQGNKPTQWVDGSLWGERATKLQQYLTKGTLLCVTLEDPHIEEFTRKDGTAGSKLVARIAALEFAGRPPEQQEQPRQEQRQEPRKQDAKAKAVQSIADMDSDIPFNNPYRGRLSYVV